MSAMIYAQISMLNKRALNGINVKPYKTANGSDTHNKLSVLFLTSLTIPNHINQATPIDTKSKMMVEGNIKNCIMI